jgi:hypothetical protein
MMVDQYFFFFFFFFFARIAKKCAAIPSRRWIPLTDALPLSTAVLTTCLFAAVKFCRTVFFILFYFESRSLADFEMAPNDGGGGALRRSLDRVLHRRLDDLEADLAADRVASVDLRSSQATETRVVRLMRCIGGGRYVVACGLWRGEKNTKKQQKKTMILQHSPNF